MGVHLLNYFGAGCLANPLSRARLDRLADLSENATEQSHAEGDAQRHDEQREQAVDQSPCLRQQTAEVKGERHFEPPF